MYVDGLVPILNVSNLPESFAWFAKLGWEKTFDWGDPADFGGVKNGETVIFLCQNGQGCRGGPMPQHARDDETGGNWMTWWVPSRAAVDECHALALKEGIIVTRPPTEEPWGIRECHIRHPDGHTFRVSCGLDA